MNNDLPKVLVIDVNAWREDAPSNTLLDIFRCWDPEKLALVYTSSAFPDTEVCSRFFQIGENQVRRSVYIPWTRVGREVKNNVVVSDKDSEAEQALRKKAHNSFNRLFRFLREVVWKLGHWKTPELLDFIRSFDPDVLFIPIFPYAYMGRIQNYIIKQTEKPFVCYLSDDNYSYDACQSLLEYAQRAWTRKYVRSLAERCNQMFVIVDKEKEDTDRRFGKDSIILTKSINFKGKSFQPPKINGVIRFVYAGSLLMGRDKSIALVADSINKINKEYGNTVAELFVYSQSPLSNKILNRLNQGDAHFEGAVSRKMIEPIIQESDVVILAEALSGKQANIAKLSFSTKITDYLSYGKCILAIGKEYIAPIDYLRRYQSAIIASNESDVYSRIKDIIQKPSIINEYGEAAYKCAINNHAEQIMRRRLIDTIVKATV